MPVPRSLRREALAIELQRRSRGVDKARAEASESPLTALATESLIREYKAVYGHDTRREVTHVAVPGSRYDLNRRATAALVEAEQLTRTGDTYHLRHVSFGRTYRLCTSEAFYEQPCAAFASGFLVQPDMLATAAHCVISADLERLRVVFDYEVTRSGPRVTFDQSQVYEIRELVACGNPDADDWALLRLDRPVINGRQPVKLRTRGHVEPGTRLYMIGHPCGLPMKFADDALVTDVSSQIFFRANLDAFGGNSGSPVFDAESDAVEGILVRGSPDFFYDTGHGCRRTSNFDVLTGADEEVCRAPLFAEHLRRRGLANLHEPDYNGPERIDTSGTLKVDESVQLLPLYPEQGTRPGGKLRRILSTTGPGLRRSRLSLCLSANGHIELTGFPWLFRVDSSESAPSLSIAPGDRTALRYFPRGRAAPMRVDVSVSYAKTLELELTVIENSYTAGIITASLAVPSLRRDPHGQKTEPNLDNPRVVYPRR